MSAIQVCHVSTMLNWGGVERLLLSTFSSPKLWENRDYSHNLLCPSEGNVDLLRGLNDVDVDICCIQRAFQFDPSVITKMRSWFEHKNVQLVHSYNGMSNSWAAMATRFSKVPYFIASSHGSAWVLRPPFSWFENWAYNKADLVITPSKAGAVILEQVAHIPEAKIRVLPNGVNPLKKVNPSTIRAKMRWGDELIIGSVGRFVNVKGFSILVEAAKLVLDKRQDVRFVLIGGGEKFNDIQAQINVFEIGEYFTLTGWRSDATEILQAFDIFVSTSISELFGNVLVEAALAGIPVIAPAVNGIPDVVVDQSTGILLTPSEPAERYFNDEARQEFPKGVVVDGKTQPAKVLSPRKLAEAILNLIEQPDICVEYGRNAQNRAQNLFTIDKYIQGLFAIYDELIS